MKIPVEILFGRKFNLGVQLSHKGSDIQNLWCNFVVGKTEYNL